MKLTLDVQNLSFEDGLLNVFKQSDFQIPSFFLFTCKAKFKLPPGISNTF